MRSAFAEKYIWICVDKTTDSTGRCIVLVIAGALSTSKFESLFFLLCDEVDQVNLTTVAQVQLKIINSVNNYNYRHFYLDFL